MTTMSDDGDRTCPLCAEEMDLTDQQLKPCKCGYEICVWCWHHIMEIAEKDETEGRCPACRTPYDKQRIVSTAASCERLVAEVSAERRHKTQKVKPKTSAEARKHLTNVRVVRKNLVYIIGLPSNLCDENLLEHKEYFGQYGKVTKVSITRPSGAAAQIASSTNTFSVYITYAREEEAIRCIQSVHNFILEGKPLRACFGTTKYCHTWLRNMSCSNPDCLYLHEIGSEEDSFTKDEIITAYTRSRVPQMAANNLQQRSGDALPPPADDMSNSVTVPGNKSLVKSSMNSTTSHVKGPNSSAAKSTVLPAAASWGMRASNSRPLGASMACPQMPVKQKIGTSDRPDSIDAFSSMDVSTKQTSAWHDVDVTASRTHEERDTPHMNGLSKRPGPLKSGIQSDYPAAMLNASSEVLQVEACPLGSSAWDDDDASASKIDEERSSLHMNDKSRPLELFRSSVVRESRTSRSDISQRGVSDASCTSSSPLPSAPESKETKVGVSENSSDQVNGIRPEIGKPYCVSGPDEISHNGATVNGSLQGLCLGISSVNIDRNIDGHQSPASNLFSTGTPKNLDSRLQQCYADNRVEDLETVALIGSSMSSSAQIQVRPTGNEVEIPLLMVEQTHGISDAHNETQSSSLCSSTNYSNDCSRGNDMGSIHPSVNRDSWTVDGSVEKASFLHRGDESMLFSKQNSLCNFFEPERVSESSEMNLTDQKVELGRFSFKANMDKNASVDIGGNSNVSDIWSLDFDPWNHSLSSANDFTKLLGETNRQDSSLLSSSSRKPPSSKQSRFSFARQENQVDLLESSFREVGQQQPSSLSRDSYRDGLQNDFQFSNFEGQDAFVSSNPAVLPNRHIGVSRAKVSAPPGFSLPSKAPPPGFSFQDRYDQGLEAGYSENNMHGNSSLGNQYEVQQSNNVVDVEFIDPAILAVGKGRMPLGATNSGLGLRSSFPARLSNSDTDPGLQLLMQQTNSSHQNQRISDRIGDRFLPLPNTYTTSRLLAQNQSNLSPFAHLSLQQPRNSPMSINQWDGWNGMQTVNNMGMAEILRNERYGINNYYPGNEEHKFHIPSSADIYGRAFGFLVSSFAAGLLETVEGCVRENYQTEVEAVAHPVLLKC